MTPFTRSPRVFYGWYVLAASFAILFLNGGGRNTIGIMFKPMADEFGWSRGAISAAVFANLAVYALASILMGRVYDRHGPKWVVAGSTILFSAGFALMATMDSLWQFLLYYGLLNAAGLGGITVPMFGSIIGNWFERRRGLAVSLALAGSCLGQFFLLPVFSSLVIGSGWRVTSLWIAGASVALNLPLVFAVIRGDPAYYHLEPYGSDEAARPAKAAAAAQIPGLTLGQALRTRSLWMFTIIMFVCGGGDYLVITHLVPMATDYGLPAAT